MRSPWIRTHPTTAWLGIVFVALALFAAACGSDDDTAAGPSTTIGDDDHDDGEDDHDDFGFGEPADPADADRVIELDATDDFTFEPADVEVEAGEIVTFRVTNVGNLSHDFTIGDADVQADHEAEMADMPMGDADGHDANAMTIGAGETGEMTWHFTEAGETLMGCHIPGHYDAGMRGTISIMEPA